MRHTFSILLTTCAAATLGFSPALADETTPTTPAISAPTPDPTIVAFEKAAANFSKSVLKIRDDLAMVKTGAQLAPLLRQWADVNANFVKAAKALSTKYPEPPPEFKPTMDKMNKVLQGPGARVPALLGDLTRQYQDDPSVKSAMEYAQQKAQAAKETP